jgi:hypothetical protein
MPDPISLLPPIIGIWDAIYNEETLTYELVDVPDGWFICDGSNGTPDLRGRFIPCAGDKYVVGDTGGVNFIDLPAHLHSLDGITIYGEMGYYNPHRHILPIVQIPSVTLSTIGATAGTTLWTNPTHTHWTRYGPVLTLPDYKYTLPEISIHHHNLEGETLETDATTWDYPPPYKVLAYIMKAKGNQ